MKCAILMRNMLARLKIYTKPLTLMVVVLVAFIGGIVVGAKHVGSRYLPGTVAAAIYTGAPSDVDLTPIWKVWNILDDRFVPSYPDEASTTPVTPAEVTQDRIWGMAEGLAASTKDPYTVFMPPEDAQMFQDDISGSFEGVGMEIGIRDGVLTVVSPLKGTPASKAGIKALDRILTIDGVATDGMSTNVAVKRIRGPKGTTVTFDVLRESTGEKLSIPVVRDVIDIPTVETRQLPTGEFVIELMQFSANAPELFRQALQEFIDTGDTNKLIIDLRGNPGGYLDAAVDIASWFLPKGDIVVTEDYGTDGDKVEHRSKGRDIFNDNLKLVILVDKGSASASEILAGALHEYGKATLIGTNTFGKGSVQELVDITSDTSLKVTVARWLLPNGVHISKEGIAPDVRVELPEKTSADTDEIMNRAVEYLKTGK